MRYSLLLCLLFSSIASSAQKNKKENTVPVSFQSFDTAFARVLTNWHAAGFAVAVVQKDKVIFSKGYGYKDYENKVPATENTQFAIGSCTKAFTASILGLLANEGKLDLDKPVRNYYPDVRFFNNDMNDHLTIKDMMCHRTGLTRFDYSWYYFPTTGKDTLVRRMQFMEPNYGLREKWQYNNFMFLLQGVVAEKLTGKTWEQNIKQRILDSIGMTNTSVSLKEWIAAKDLSKGYDIKNDSIIHHLPYYDISGMSPAGSINSSVTDMAQWLKVWINGGKYNGRQILPATYVHDAMSQQMVIGDGTPSEKSPDIHMGAYGYGWMISSYRGHYRVAHGGNIDGFSALTTFYPSDSLGIVVLVNQNGSSVPSIVTNLIADKILKLPFKEWNNFLKNLDTLGNAAAKLSDGKVESTQKKGTHPSHALSDYVGRFESEAGEVIKVTKSGDSLFMHTPNKSFWLSHYHYDVFTVIEKDPVEGIDTTNFADQVRNSLKATFNIDSRGDIGSVLLPLENPDKPYSFKRKAEPAVISKDSLQKYVGEFDLAGKVTVKTYIKNDNTLFLFVPGQPEYELVPIGNNTFNLKKLDGYSTKFEVDNKNEVTGITFIQPNGVFKAEKKKEKKP